MTISITSPTSNTGAIQQNGSNVLTIDSSNRLTATNGIYINGALASGYTMKNRIINGAMTIAQYSTSSQTATGYATVDRWAYYSGGISGKFNWQQNAGSVTTPVGFSNYLGFTSTSAYTVGSGEKFILQQTIEGFNTSDLMFGTANAKTVTISFWVYSSLTGTFGGALQNYASTRSYPFSYTISAANTWEQKSVTIAGDTSGTWVGASNAASFALIFSLGAGSTLSGTAGAWAGANYVSATGATSVVGTNGATFYITGVQLEVGSTATAFEWRPYGMELQLCQRYFYKVIADATYGTNRYGPVFFPTSVVAAGLIQFPVTMRTFPTGSYSSLSDWTISAAVGTLSVTAIAINTMPYNSEIDFTVSGATAGQGGQIRSNATTATMSFSAEL